MVRVREHLWVNRISKNKIDNSCILFIDSKVEKTFDLNTEPVTMKIRQCYCSYSETEIA